MVGLTKSDVFSMILKDWIAYAAWPGGKVVFSPPHPDVAKEYSAGSMHVEFTDTPPNKWFCRDGTRRRTDVCLL